MGTRLQVETNRFLSEFSTFGIGGPIRFFVEVSSIDQMAEAFQMNRPTLIVGRGSNCLFDDRGFDGLVILNRIDFCEWNGAKVAVGAGYNFSLLGTQSARKNLSGLEFASGIPATVGGAVFMNAGANGKETCDPLESVLYLSKEGMKREFKKEELQFGYRTSSFQKMDGAILSAVFSLAPADEARNTQLRIIDHRMKTQPLKDKSAGCIFRNPLGQSAGALIDRAGLKGTRVGGAKVSEIHANFLINEGNATCRDVLNLIQLVQERVLKHTGFYLEPEVRIIPYGENERTISS
jgi:UDP-N-acetylmuramate dehydrogenase